jgi:hypothetical protein
MINSYTSRVMLALKHLHGVNRMCEHEIDVEVLVAISTLRRLNRILCGKQ